MFPFLIDFTRRTVVKMRKKVSCAQKVIFVHISNNSRAWMVLIRQWFLWWIRIQLLLAISPSVLSSFA